MNCLPSGSFILQFDEIISLNNFNLSSKTIIAGNRWTFLIYNILCLTQNYLEEKFWTLSFLFNIMVLNDSHVVIADGLVNGCYLWLFPGTDLGMSIRLCPQIALSLTTGYVYTCMLNQAGQTRFLLQYMYTMSSDYVDFGHNLRRSLMTNLCSTENRVSLDVVKTYCSPYVRVYLLRLQRVGLKVKDCGEARSLY